MKISYSTSNSDDRILEGRPSGQRPMQIILIVVVIGLFAGAGWWAYQRALTVPEPVASVPNQDAPVPPRPVTPQESAQIMHTCEKQFPSLNTADDRRKRTRCYFSAMIAFGTAEVCASAKDADASSLCQQAQVMFKEEQQASASVSSRPSGQTNSNQTGSPSGTQQQTSPAVTNRNGGGTNTNNGGTGTGTTNGNSASGTNTNVPTNTNSATNTNAPTNTNTSTNTNTETGGVLCYNERGEIILLQHTNTCPE